MTVSIIIAAYNVEEHIERALESLVNQTSPDWEAIVVNDCSTDGTIRVVEDLARIDSRIRLISLTENGGPSIARNVGIEHARGEIIGVLDADDAYTDSRIAHVVSIMARYKSDVILDNMYLYDDFEKRVVETAYPVSKTVEELDINSIVESEGVGKVFRYGFLKPMVRKQFLLTNNISYHPGIRLAEDFLLLSEIALSRGKVHITYEPGYIYTTQYSLISGVASTGSRTQVRYYDRILVADHLIKKYSLSTNSKTKNLLRRYRQWMVRDYKVVKISQQVRSRNFSVILTAILSPLAAVEFVTSSRTAARFRARWLGRAS